MHTYGVLIFQEQVMAIGNVMGNMTLRQADNFRKAIKLKESEKFKVWQKKFMKGAKKNGVSKKISKQVWDWMYKFSGYGFNRAHAAAYALICYQTAWLKYYYRKEFMACVMSEVQKGDKAKEKLPRCIKESKEHFEVKVPNIKYSTDRFEVEKDSLLFPLSVIKGLGEKAIESIIETRKEEQYDSFVDFYERVNKRVVNVGVISTIILADAFRNFGTREEIFDEFMEIRGTDKVARQVYCNSCKYRYPCAIKEDDTPTCPSCGSASVMVDSEKCAGKKFNLSYCENNFVFGFLVKENPLTRYLPQMLRYDYLNFEDILEYSFNTMVKFMATVMEIKKHIDKNGNTMAFIKLRDMHNDESDLCVFAHDWDELQLKVKTGGHYKFKVLKTQSQWKEDVNNFLFDSRNKSAIKGLS